MSFSALRDHALHATVRRILEMRGLPVFSIEAVTFNEGYTYSRNKIFAVVQVLENLLKSTPEELQSLTGLNSINNHLQPLLAELTGFISDENPVHLDNAVSALEGNILPAMWAFTPSAQPILVDVLPELLQAQQKFAMESVRQVADASDSLSAHLVELDEEVLVLRAKLNEITESAVKERAEAAAAVAKLEQTFTQAEGVRQQNFEESLRVSSGRVEELIDAIKNSTEALVSELEEKRSQAAQIVQVVGNIGATGNYQRIADNESKQANIWRLVTLGILAVGIAVAAATFIKFWGEALTAETAPAILIRLLYAIVITTPAWYSARESARHRSNADRARLTELELASIGPFIELLPEEKKIEIRTRLTHLYFGRTSDPHVVKNPFDLAELNGIVTDAVKAAKG
ncbi:hypothetical protein C1886_12185 [Pseudomonas sp. FW300-N1A1]|uniref:hypothetical protein n=1 Tax=Pseudomonas sp. FW300-N1A1 TaxID=2075555 RepID=UPI000CD1DB23|nr:hypothetical protein [Pseudomonas sp. FW300-N1A1]POA19629.1 hypothetical protein C1886_12185 [Pseudomonas sp. FW300-N1A1]